ncbi:hypothetical protein Tco_0909655 [Tanacetum coccineum]|uniref:Retrotransposon gag domain-containing protein n=1 Tax=Tanacetum coccineum TaxID=301880 RepID=A0ABQ5CRV4_9ASTR
MTNGREIMPPLGFLTPPQILNIVTSERLPMTTTVFVATTYENTPSAYRASTLANPNPMISPAFVEANYEVLESLLRERRRRIRNENLLTGLEYFSEDYDEEREMEPRPEPNRETTPPLRLRGGRNAEGSMPLEIETRENGNRGVNLPPLLATHLGRNESGSFADSTGFVTHFLRWIEDYPLSDGLKMTSYIGSYDGKGDPDNFLHLFEGAIRMQKYQKAGSILNYEDLKAKFRSHFSQQKKFTKTHLAILGLHEEQHIFGFVHGLRTRSLVEHLSTNLPSTYKGLMEKTYTWIEAREVATNGALNEQREIFERSKKSFWENDKGQKSRDRTKYCHFHKDYGHDTNQCRELKHQIEEAVKSGQVSHLAKGLKKKKEKKSDTHLGKRKKDGKDATPVEAPILMIRRESHNQRKRPVEGNYAEAGEITFPPLRNRSSADPVIIRAYVSGRQVYMVYLDGGRRAK